MNTFGTVTTQPFTTFFNPASAGLSYGDYNLRAVATDQGGKTDTAPSLIPVTYTNVQPPLDLNAVTNDKNVTLTWTGNGSGYLQGYNVYRSSGNTWTKINATLLTTASCQDSNLSTVAISIENVASQATTTADTTGNFSADVTLTAGENRITARGQHGQYQPCRSRDSRHAHHNL